jgi:peptidoglycan/LPS O-acetylase OafA/YrhL
MPKPLKSGQRYLPGLDGLRALAVLAVIAYHEQLSWAPGGLLGVGVFFTLSGYLITDLLLAQWSANGRLQLGDFWIRRARRLLPALFVMLTVVIAWVTIADRARLAGLRGAVGAAATYWSNWYLISRSGSYFSRFAPPGPLDHLWSLAVEEQFYLLWPWLLLLGLLALRRRRTRSGENPALGSARVPTLGSARVPTLGSARGLALPTIALATASVAAMLVMYQPGVDPTRVYEGTDTRAFGLLIGAALAMAWPSRRLVTGAIATRLLDAAGLGGLVLIAVLIWRVGQYSPFLYRGGLVLLSIATAAVIAAAASPGGLVGRALGCRPLRWLGVRSYGIYLWHYPVIVLTSPANSAQDLPRAAVQVGASVVLAALSWKFVEEPVRQGALGRGWTRVRAQGWRAQGWHVQGWHVRGWHVQGWQLGRVRLSSVVAMTGTTAVVVVACLGLTGAISVPAAPAGSQDTVSASAGGLASDSQSVTRAAPQPALAGPTQSAGRPASSVSSPAGSSVSSPAGSSASSPAASGPPRTSCQAVAHLGDSTSEGMVSSDYLPRASQRLPEQYEDVGVQSVRTDISGARSVVEVLPGQVNGYNAARAMAREGFRGCWVLALGTNDTADVAAGSQVGLMTRIQRMMSAANGEPVMWVNLKSLLATGPYAEANMLRWDTTLLRACARYPNMRVYDWASVVKTRWFISDGIHYTSAGYAARSRMIAEALAAAFPRSGHSNSCAVQ